MGPAAKKQKKIGPAAKKQKKMGTAAKKQKKMGTAAKKQKVAVKTEDPDIEELIPRDMVFVYEEAERVKNEIISTNCFDSPLVNKLLSILGVLNIPDVPHFSTDIIHQLIDMEKYNALPEGIRRICDIHHQGLARVVTLDGVRYNRQDIFTACRAIYISLCPDEFKPQFEQFKSLIHWLGSNTDDMTITKRAKRIRKAMTYVEKRNGGDEDASESILKDMRSELRLSDLLKDTSGGITVRTEIYEKLMAVTDDESARPVLKRILVDESPSIARQAIGEWLFWKTFENNGGIQL